MKEFKEGEAKYDIFLFSRCPEEEYLMNIEFNKLAPGHLESVKDKKTGEVKKNVWNIIVDVPKSPGGNRKRKATKFHGGKKEADAELQRLRMYYSDHENIEQPTCC